LGTAGGFALGAVAGVTLVALNIFDFPEVEAVELTVAGSLTTGGRFNPDILANERGAAEPKD
jgi:hypothetical protein